MLLLCLGPLLPPTVPHAQPPHRLITTHSVHLCCLPPSTQGPDGARNRHSLDANSCGQPSERDRARWEVKSVTLRREWSAVETRKGKPLGLGDAARPHCPGHEQTLCSWQPWETSGNVRACCHKTCELLPQLLSRLPGRLLRSPASPGWHLQGQHMLLLLPGTDLPPWETSGAGDMCPE